jgi:hypothetical protein
MVQADELRGGDCGGIHCATCRKFLSCSSQTTQRGIHNHVSVESITAPASATTAATAGLKKKGWRPRGFEVRFVEFSNGSVFVVPPRVFSTLPQRIV